MNNEDNIENRLVEETNREYINLSKWMIGLSTGAIVFSVRFIKPETPQYLNSILIYGLGFLVLNIITGVIFVRLRIDALYYELIDLRAKSEISGLSNNNPEEEIERGGKKTKVKDILKHDDCVIKKANKRFKIINDVIVVILPIHQWSFFFGILFIAIFGGGVLY
ncbi:MAG: hypothetical protein PHO67_07005 [Candidatus Omnitrophica bacterium]|nr:hypothetical protein [Candidatus Omnitrophota bacterium]